MKTYCSNCGFKIEHQAFQKPNFCPKCGFSLGSAKGQVEQRQPEYEDIEEEQETSFSSDMSGLDVDIMENPSKGHKLSDLAGTSNGPAKPQPKPKRGRGRPKKVKNKDVWQEFKDEAGGNPIREQE
tara:strand:- start:240 stop:617 length:378 start_codon:yes stop_codon:yes gene_type:complete